MNAYYVRYDETGTILSSGHMLPAHLAKHVEAGENIVGTDRQIPIDGTYKVNVSDKSIVPVEPAAPTIEELRAAKLADLANLRWRKEIGGFTFEGSTFATSRESQASMNSNRLMFLQGDITSVDWKTKDGMFVTFDASSFSALCAAVFGFVNACFRREKTLASLIKVASTEDALNAIDISSDWPSAS